MLKQEDFFPRGRSHGYLVSVQKAPPRTESIRLQVVVFDQSLVITCQVIVMTTQWKSGMEREPLGLIQPNPYYREVAQRLINSQQVRLGSTT